jgi:hypothetical protein
MKRTQVTHIKKHDGSWWQLVIVRDGDDGCIFCPFGPGFCEEPINFDCTVLEDNDNKREDYWKEIGPK